MNDQIEGAVYLVRVGFNSYRVKKDTKYHIGFFNSGRILKVPAGFLTSYSGQKAQAKIPHQYMYFRGAHTRNRADRIYQELLEVCGCSAEEAYLAYLSARIFGVFRWSYYRCLEWVGWKAVEI